MTIKDTIIKSFGNTVTIQATIYVSDYVYKKRSWKERLFSLPWKPLLSSLCIKEPKAIFLEADNLVLVSPETYSKLNEVIK